jgi:hypothetical protein
MDEGLVGGEREVADHSFSTGGPHAAANLIVVVLQEWAKRLVDGERVVADHSFSTGEPHAAANLIVVVLQEGKAGGAGDSQASNQDGCHLLHEVGIAKG